MENKTDHWHSLSSEERMRAYTNIRALVHKRKRGTVLKLLELSNPLISFSLNDATGAEFVKIENVGAEQFFIALKNYLYLKKLNS